MWFFSQALEMVSKVEYTRWGSCAGGCGSSVVGQSGVAYAEYFGLSLWDRWG